MLSYLTSVIHLTFTFKRLVEMRVEGVGAYGYNRPFTLGELFVFMRTYQHK